MIAGTGCGRTTALRAGILFPMREVNAIAMPSTSINRGLSVGRAEYSENPRVAKGCASGGRLTLPAPPRIVPTLLSRDDLRHGTAQRKIGAGDWGWYGRRRMGQRQGLRGPVGSRRRKSGLFDLDAELAEEAAASIRAEGGDAVTVAGNAATSGDVKRAVDNAVQAFGGLHIVVNNVGIVVPGAWWSCLKVIGIARSTSI